jgi:mRNA interferase RelE/StbE
LLKHSNIADVKMIVLQPSAARALDKLPADVRTRLEQALTTYALSGQGDAKAMVGTPTVRLRIGDFRIIFDESAEIIRVLVIGHRRDIYR